MKPMDTQPTDSPSVMAAEAAKFSIFNPVITYEHREFYERIIGELSGIFPICNQGKCTAVEISENVTEQEQITDLMKKVENFSFQLLGVTKRLFDQFYQAKEDFCKSIFSTTAYIKINLLDRNLLERTCDVRWWSLETAFADCLSLFDAVTNLLQSAEAIGVKPGASDPVVKACEYLRSQSGVSAGKLANPENLSRFRGALDCLIDADNCLLLTEDTTDVIAKLRAACEDIGGKVRFACDRLEDINNSYTLYRDLVITDRQGCIVASSNEQTREGLLGTSVADESWFLDAMQTKDATQYAVRDLCGSHVEPDQDNSLIYSTAVRENGDSAGRTLGAMGVFF
ncbi:MAG: hypothetical protein EA402_07125 [Planctomycetota bacterium]|nr:MAG: hypothetical protein EA402_07125 [Planctomycetota bacterium]